jgi:hypothetical protein
LSTDASEEHIASIFGAEKISLAACPLLAHWFFVDLIFLNPEDGGDMFLRSVG